MTLAISLFSGRKLKHKIQGSTWSMLPTGKPSFVFISMNFSLFLLGPFISFHISSALDALSLIFRSKAPPPQQHRIAQAIAQVSNHPIPEVPARKAQKAHCQVPSPGFAHTQHTKPASKSNGNWCTNPCERPFRHRSVKLAQV